jgi:hypothetical protein
MPKKPPQFLTQAEFAKEAGVQRQNIFNLIKSGRLTANADNKLDRYDPRNFEYLQDKEQRARKSNEQTKDEGPNYLADAQSLDELKKKTERQRGIKLEIENKTKRNELVTRDSVKRVFAKSHMIDETMFKNLGQNCAPNIMAIGGIVEDSKQIEIQAEIDDAVHRILSSAKKLMDDFLNDVTADDE